MSNPDNNRRKFGILASAAYVAAMLVYGVVQHDPVFEMKPNEFGDLLAGIFAPLAFLWLVLGFYQQGEELRNSNRALEIQADELRSSVEQQRELVNVTREQVDFEKQRAEKAEAERKKAAQPKFQLRWDGYHESTREGAITHKFRIINFGPACTDVNITYDNGQTAPVSIFRNGAGIDFEVEYSPGDFDEYHVTVDFTDNLGLRGTKRFRIFPSDNGQLGIMTVG